MKFLPLTAIWGLLALALVAAPLADESTSPQRIISLAPSTTEMLFALGVGDSLVGRSDFCRYPPEVQDLPTVGGLLNLDFEALIALEPDLVISPFFADDTQAHLEATGADVLAVPSDSVDEVLASIPIIAERLNRSEAGRQLVASIRASMETIAGRLSGLEPRRVLVIVDRGRGTFQNIFASGTGSFLSELVELAGGVNVLESTLGPFPQISREVIIATDPEVIIDTSLAQAGSSPDASERALALYERDLGGVTAVRERRVILWMDPRLTIPGPSMPEQIEALGAVIHPEAAE